ncbi:MAG TPA: hypothetical protein VM050_03765, partial [Patescibacteria group bacterium]|nr:hypothetical protein [Patescibacteria group bacterium]
RHLKFDDIGVGGTVSLSGGEGGSVKVGGTLKSDGDLSFDEIDVGGTVKIDGNAAGNTLDVGGTLTVQGDFMLTNDLKVGGKADIIGNLKAKSVSVGGKVEAYQVEAEEEITTSVLRTVKGAKADRIEIGRRGEAQGPLIARSVMIRSRGRVEDIHAEEVHIRSNSRVGSIYADRIEVESGCRIRGEVKYTGSLDAESGVEFSREPEKTEKLPSPPL